MLNSAKVRINERSNASVFLIPEVKTISYLFANDVCHASASMFERDQFEGDGKRDDRGRIDEQQPVQITPLLDKRLSEEFQVTETSSLGMTEPDEIADVTEVWSLSQQFAREIYCYILVIFCRWNAPVDIWNRGGSQNVYRVGEFSMVDLLGYAGGVFLMISFLPQIIKSMQTESMGDLSWGMLGASAASGTFYEIYAYFLGLTPVVIMNGIFVASVLTAMLMKANFDRKARVAVE